MDGVISSLEHQQILSAFLSAIKRKGQSNVYIGHILRMKIDHEFRNTSQSNKTQKSKKIKLYIYSTKVASDGAETMNVRGIRK